MRPAQHLVATATTLHILQRSNRIRSSAAVKTQVFIFSETRSGFSAAISQSKPTRPSVPAALAANGILQQLIGIVITTTNTPRPCGSHYQNIGASVKNTDWNIRNSHRRWENMQSSRRKAPRPRFELRTFLLPGNGANRRATKCKISRKICFFTVLTAITADSVCDLRRHKSSDQK